jgi:hypothetical protein
MTDAYFYARWGEQEGWEQDTTHASPQTYKTEYFGGINVDPNRYFMTRFFDVDLPVGATITAAYVVYYIYAKNDGDAQNFTYDYTYEATTVGGTTIRQDATPLRRNTYESSTANRTWGANVVSGGTFNWNTSLGDNQTFQVNVTSIIQQAFANSGRHMNLAFRMKVLTETGDMGIGNNANGWKQRLLIQYTGGTANNEAVLANDNPNFLQLQEPRDAGAPAYWVNNPVFGAYQSNPTYLTQASHAGIPAAPMGGNTLKITSNNDNQRVVAWHISPNDLTWGSWYCFSVFVYVPTGVSDARIVFLDRVFNVDIGRISTKNTWLRAYMPFLVSPDRDPFLGVASVDGMAVGQSIYVANFNFTKGRELLPYFDGNSTDTATYHRTFDWGGGTTGRRDGGLAYVTLDNKPTVTGGTQPTAATNKALTTLWNYTDPYSEAQSRVRVEVRKKRVP